MNDENLINYMNKVNIINKEISEYTNEETGVKYIIPTAHLIVRIEYMELKEEELKSLQFQQTIDKNIKFKSKITTRPRPKYEITKKEEDKYTLIDAKVKVYEIWNVVNGLKIKQSFNNKEEALKLYDDINTPIKKIICE